MKVVIVGGVAGGASCAARLRRLDENAEIVMVEKGPYVSYANCGLPYYVGGVIEKESSLLVASEKMFKVMFSSTGTSSRRGCPGAAQSTWPRRWPRLHHRRTSNTGKVPLDLARKGCGSTTRSARPRRP